MMFLVQCSVQIEKNEMAKNYHKMYEFKIFNLGREKNGKDNNITYKVFSTLLTLLKVYGGILNIDIKIPKNALFNL